jgi:drug/metabolite transporter (DMT)-like permease
MESKDEEKAEPDELDALLQRTEMAETPPSEKRTKAHRKAQSLLSFKASGVDNSNKRPSRHHRAQSLWGPFSHGLESIAEGVQAEAQLIGGTLVEELNVGESGRRYFLDMSMTRSLSVLPEDMPDFVDETVGHEIPHDIPTEEKANGLVRYAGLLIAVLAVSSNGTALSLLHNVPPPLKLYWRMTATAMALSLFSIRHTYKEGVPKLTAQQWITFVLAAFCYSIHAICFIYALKYTSIGNAVIGANSQAILLILGRLIVGAQVIPMEGGGILLAFTGAVLCSTDEARDSKTQGGSFGDLLAVTSGALGVGYLTFAKACRSHMAVTIFMFLNMILSSVIVVLFMLMAGIELSISNDIYNGLFGWMNTEEHRLYVMIHLAVICNILGTMGFVRAMQYFENIVIAVATLLEPLLATVIAFVAGVGYLPGPMGWVGNLLVVVGTFSVVYPSVNSSSASH